jgi:hypothetical protein
MLFFVAYGSSVIGRTEITVYENGVTGIGFTGITDASGRLSLGLIFQPSIFRFTYDKIANVKVINNKVMVTIQASGGPYISHTKNRLVANEVRRIIVAQQEKHKTASTG